MIVRKKDYARHLFGASRARHVGSVIVAVLFSALTSNAVLAQTLERVSVDSSGLAGNSENTRPAISADGRFVAFSSTANNLVSGDTNLVRDIFVHDRTTNVTVRVSISSAGVQANAKSGRPAISGDGRYVAFYSDASNLIDIDGNTARDIFVHDRDPDGNGSFDEGNGVTILASIATNMFRGNASSTRPAISADGKFVVFRTSASTLVPGDTNGLDDILVRDLTANTTVRLNVDDAGAQATGGESDRPSISADGRFVAFYSDAFNLVTGDEQAFNPTTCPTCTGVRDIFVRDRDPDTNGVFDEGNGVTIRVSVTSAGDAGNGTSTRSAISSNGQFVAYKSTATNLVTGDSNGADDVFVHDLQTAVTTRVSVASDSSQANGESSVPVISGDGRYVAFRSLATNLVAGVGNGFEQVYMVDRQTLAVTAVSVGANGLAGNNASSRPSISADAKFVAFYSDASSLITNDTNLARDVLVRNLDVDNDTILEGVDNCPALANTDQVDLDSDGLGDVCDDDRDGDGFPNAVDGCPEDANKSTPQDCGCGVAEVDTDGDGTSDCKDLCPNDANKIAPGVCGCSTPDIDQGGGNVTCADTCPNDPTKLAPGVCGCGVADVDTDGDGSVNCNDSCPNDPAKITPGVCGCGSTDIDDGNGNVVCVDDCPDDPAKTSPGACGCGNLDTDTDGDSLADCIDNCVQVVNSTQTDTDGDGLGDVCDNCPALANVDQSDDDNNGVGNACEVVDSGNVNDGVDEPGAPIPNTDGQSQPLCGAFGMVGLLTMFFGLTAMRRRKRFNHAAITHETSYENNTRSL